jgi:crossover junction endodeoxyribonuclease RuvC
MRPSRVTSVRVLGIDPGSRVTGYGLIDSDGRCSTYVASGCIRVRAQSLSERLGLIFREVHAIVDAYRPQVMAIEEVFMARNAASALKLGHARSAAICAVVDQHLPVSEYSPRSIKQALVGNGGAEKEQVQHMVRHLLALREALASDAADALAVALCHAHTRSTLNRIPVQSFGRRR